MPGAKTLKLPRHWVRIDGRSYCLACRRAMAAEAGLEDAPEDMPIARRAKVRNAALLDFEVMRDPERPAGVIAKACRTSVVAVVKARERLGLAEPT
jgi:hypothetical protein